MANDLGRSGRRFHCRHHRLGLVLSALWLSRHSRLCGSLRPLNSRFLNFVSRLSWRLRPKTRTKLLLRARCDDGYRRCSPHRGRVQQTACGSSDRELTRNFENLLDALSASAVEIAQLSRQGKKDEALNALNTRFSAAFDSAMDAERHCSSLRLAGASQLAASAGSLAQSSLIAVWTVFGIAATFGVFLCLYST